MRIGILVWLLLVVGIDVQAQSLPEIELFAVDNPVLNYPAVEAGTAAANFSWRAVGLRDGDQMQMHALVGDQWGLIGAGFEPVSADLLVIAHPLDFVPPLYRLSVVDVNGTIVVEQRLELNYASPEGLPAIAMFEMWPKTFHKPLVPATAFEEPLHVQWRVDNRWFNSNLVFEQILPDGTVLNAEYSRPKEWQYAHRSDYLPIVYPGDYADVVLRLRVVNRDNGSTLTQSDLVLAVENPNLPPAEVRNFAVSSDNIDPGDTVTVSWEVANTDAVWIEYYHGKAAMCGIGFTLFENLPPSGSIEVVSPDYAFKHLELRLFADYYLSMMTRHSPYCEDGPHLVGERTVELTDYVGQGVEFFRTEPFITAVGQTVTLSWSVSEGQSVTIGWPYSADEVMELDETPPEYVIYPDLPLSGTLQVTIPDTPAMRTARGGHFWLYIIEDDMFPPAPDGSKDHLLDEDGNLECESYLNFVDLDTVGGAESAPGTEFAVTWDSCGNEDALLRFALKEGAYDAPILSEEFISVEPTGTMMLTVPDEVGLVYRVDLYYQHGGERYALDRDSVRIQDPEG